MTDAPANAEDGKDIAITKSINMMDWQANLTKSIQKADSKGNMTNISTNPHIGNYDYMTEMRNGMKQDQMQATANNSNANQVLIVKDAAALGDKSYSPNPITVKLGGVSHGLTRIKTCILLPPVCQTLRMLVNYLILV